MVVNQERIRNSVEAFESPPESYYRESIHNIARSIVRESVELKPGRKVLIRFDQPGMPLVKELYLGCIAEGAEVKFFKRELEKDAAIIPTLDDQGIKDYFNDEEDLINWAEVLLTVRGAENPKIMDTVPKDKHAIYIARYGETLKRLESGEIMWNLFSWPTEYEAAIENVPYDDYFRTVMEACNQPWAEIKKAQVLLLKDKLDRGKTLELFANEDDPDPKRRTFLKMSIDGMTFCNSTTKRNMPGSEVFSAPELESVNGQIFAPGYYLYEGKLMKDIFLKISNGKIIQAEAAVGNDDLNYFLSQTNIIDGKYPKIGGARYFGEVALGTNPGLTRRFFNTLLNEKVAGSFHMAIGNCYTHTEYDGDPVHVNNGNTNDLTPIHWDLTILMHRNSDGSGGGRVVVDGEMIQRDGFFLDERLEILNPI